MTFIGLNTMMMGVAQESKLMSFHVFTMALQPFCGRPLEPFSDIGFMQPFQKCALRVYSLHSEGKGEGTL